MADVAPDVLEAARDALRRYAWGEGYELLAMVAMALAKDHYAKGAPSIGSAWVTRAERLVADEADCVERGYLERLLSVIAFEGRADFDTALAHAGRALETARQFGDRELQALVRRDVLQRRLVRRVVLPKLAVEVC